MVPVHFSSNLLRKYFATCAIKSITSFIFKQFLLPIMPHQVPPYQILNYDAGEIKKFSNDGI